MAPSEERPTTSDEELPSWLRELEGASEVGHAEEEKEAPSPEAVVDEPPAEREEPLREELEGEPPMKAAVEEEPPTIEEEEVEIGEEAMARLRGTMPDESASIEEIMAWMERSKAIMTEEEQLEEAVEEGAPATEEARYQPEAVTLQYMLTRFSIAVPPKLEYGFAREALTTDSSGEEAAPPEDVGQ